MLYSTTLFLICFIYSSFYLIPNFWFIPPPPTFPFGKFVFYVPFLKKKLSHSLLTECLLCTKLSMRVLTSATSLKLYSIQEECGIMPILQLERQTQSVENGACSWQKSEKLLICAPSLPAPSLGSQGCSASSDNSGGLPRTLISQASSPQQWAV